MSDRDARGLGRGELHELYGALAVTRAAEALLDEISADEALTPDWAAPVRLHAGPVAAAFALRRRDDGAGDVIVPSVRSAGALFLFGGALREFFRQQLGRVTSPTRGRDAGVHWHDAARGILGPISSAGTITEVMAGVTLAFRLRDEDRVGLVFCDVEASAAGAWHEGFNLAAVQGCPLVLVVENREWDAPGLLPRSTHLESITDKGPGYGVGTEAVQGSDVLAVFDAVRRAAALARSGEGSRLVELRYPFESEPVDAVASFRARMIENGWASEEEMAALEAEADAACRAALLEARGEPEPDGADAVGDVYTDVILRGPWTREGQADPAFA